VKSLNQEKTIAGLWNIYRSAAFYPDAPLLLVELNKKSFYAGCSLMLKMVSDHALDSKLSTKEGAEWLYQRIKELKDYLDELQEKEAGRN